MSPSLKKGLLSSVYVLWISLFCVGAVRTTRSVLHFYYAVQHTHLIAQELQSQAQRITDATHDIHERHRETEFLQSLTNLLPQSKSFIRTQRAMSDEVETLRYKVGRRIKNDLHILVDTRANKLYVKKGLTLLWEADCSVGKGGILTDKKTGRRWEFVTPHGQFEVHDKIENPVWTKPDWAFVETGEKVPPPEDASRHVQGELGGYVFNLGDGYLIHGTKNEAVLGHSVSHGCVRLGADDLKKLYELAPRGTRVYIY